MSWNFEQICQAYDRLEPDTHSPWEIYAGDAGRTMAEEKGIPQEKWEDDRISLQLGQEVMADVFKEDVPGSREEWETLIWDMTSRQICGRLRAERNDMARRGLLVQMLRGDMLLEAAQNKTPVDENALDMLNRLDLDTLTEKVTETAMRWTMDKVLPAIQHQCELLMMEPDQEAKVLNNPGALAVAGYLEIPELRNTPEVAGAAAEATVCFTNYSGTENPDTLECIAMGLLALAIGTAIIALIMLSTGVAVPGIVHLLTEGTVAGIGATIAEEMAFIITYVIGMMKFSLGSTILSGIVKAVSHLVQYLTPTETIVVPNPIHEIAPHLETAQSRRIITL